jgi:hypothetical protein
MPPPPSPSRWRQLLLLAAIALVVVGDLGLIDNPWLIAKIAALLAYIALWRPRVNALRWSRALAIAEEVLALMETEGRDRVTRALSAAVDALQPRAQQPDWTPLSNHRYLLSCLASTSAQALAVAPAARGETWNATPSATPSATLTGLAGLEALR